MTEYEKRPSQGLNAAVAAVLRGERGASGLTFDGLAEASGISKRQLIRLLTKTERHLDVAAIAALADVFGMTVSEVIARAEERMRRTEGVGDPDVYEAIRQSRPLRKTIAKKAASGTDQRPPGGTALPNQKRGT